MFIYKNKIQRLKQLFKAQINIITYLLMLTALLNITHCSLIHFCLY